MPLMKMERYTLHHQRIEIVKIHYKNDENFCEIVRKVTSFFGHCEAPSRPAIILMNISRFSSQILVAVVRHSPQSRQ